ncbi:hypothetical protein FQA39_LY11162 [Lamprigera yunnana]|nr:hypothetical protein FQA39_LY11162 [Lamprigera yunnana]
MSVRALPAELQQVAINELNEIPNQIQNDIQTIKDWIAKQPHLNTNMDDELILRFLRGCKFSLEFTKDKIDFYYSIRTLSPKFVTNRDPLLPEIQKFLKLKVYMPLDVNKCGPQTFMAQLGFRGKDDGSVSLYTVIKTSLMMLEIMMKENEYMLLGQILFLDLEHISITRVAEFTITDVRTIISLQLAYPVRLKHVIFYGTPAYAKKAYDLFSYLVPEKIKNRILFYNQDDLEKIQDIIPKSILLKEYGGEACSDKLGDYWIQKLESYREWFLKDDMYGTDESKRSEKKYDLDGIQGSFRKLQVD